MSEDQHEQELREIVELKCQPLLESAKNLRCKHDQQYAINFRY